MDSRRVGILGGGQLGRMMAEAGHRLGVHIAGITVIIYNALYTSLYFIHIYPSLLF
jgi:phosphoglycerate dehydrogenase-like enzyme